MPALKSSRPRLLVLHVRYTDVLSYYDDWLDALLASPLVVVQAVDLAGEGALEAVRRVLPEVDACLCLHSTNGNSLEAILRTAGVLQDRRVPLLSFVGNEVNLPGVPIRKKRALFERLHPEMILTQLLEEAGRHLWGDVAGSVRSLPHGLNDKVFSKLKDTSRRPIDLGVRADPYPPHLGDNDRRRLLDACRALGEGGAWRVDIDGARFDRRGWVAFLNECKASVANEAGSWFLERDDRTVEAIRAWARARRGGPLVIDTDSRLRRLSALAPDWLKALPRALLKKGVLENEADLVERLDFDEVFERFFKDRPRPEFYGKCISSRHFDAVGTGTCQLLLRGRYNDILEPGEHFVELLPDLSNLQDAMRLVVDPDARRTLSSRALEHVLSGHTYGHRIEALSRLLEEAASPTARCEDRGRA